MLMIFTLLNFTSDQFLWVKYDLESCGAKFLAPQLRNTLPWLLWPRLEPTRLYFTQSRPDRSILSSTPKLSGLGLQQACEYNQKWSHNILQHDKQCPIFAVLTQLGKARHGFHLIPLNLRNSLKKIYDTPIKNTPTRTRSKSLSPTRPDPKIFS